VTLATLVIGDYKNGQFLGKRHTVFLVYTHTTTHVPRPLGISKKFVYKTTVKVAVNLTPWPCIFRGTNYGLKKNST
jgi:hypothetical protein